MLERPLKITEILSQILPTSQFKGFCKLLQKELVGQLHNHLSRGRPLANWKRNNGFLSTCLAGLSPIAVSSGGFGKIFFTLWALPFGARAQRSVLSGIAPYRGVDVFGWLAFLYPFNQFLDSAWSSNGLMWDEHLASKVCLQQIYVHSITRFGRAVVAQWKQWSIPWSERCLWVRDVGGVVNHCTGGNQAMLDALRYEEYSASRPVLGRPMPSP